MKKIKLLILLILLVACSPEVSTPTPAVPKPPIQETPRIEFNLDGINYKFPIEVSKFIEDGWETSSSLSEGVISPNTFIPNYFFRKGTSIVKVSLYNPGATEISLDESLISEIALENRTFKNDVAPQIMINDFLDFTTPIAIIEEKFGAPKFSDDAVFDYYDFNLDSKNSIRVEIYKDRRDGDVSRWIVIKSYES